VVLGSDIRPDIALKLDGASGGRRQRRMVERRGQNEKPDVMPLGGGLVCNFQGALLQIVGSSLKNTLVWITIHNRHPN
jgi:hypothetical protein